MATSDELAMALQSGHDDVPLKVKLRRAERARKLGFVALIVPLAVFVVLTFLWPLGSLLMRSVANPEVVGALPKTTQALKGWDGKALPKEAAFAALAADLAAIKGTSDLAAAAKRLNMETIGFRSLLMGASRDLSFEPGKSAKEAFIALDERWGQIQSWQTIARNASPWTLYYLLAAVDFTVDDTGSIINADAEHAIYREILARTLWMSAIVTFWCLLLGFPIAYLLATQPPRIANLLMILVLLPFWTSVLVRVAAWIVLLQNEGPLNTAMIKLGLIDQPVQLVFNWIGVYIAMVHILLPFAVLPLYSVMKGVSPTLMRAALSLGCPPFQSFWKVYFPQTLPGIGAGGLLVFILSMGYYITPALLGSPKEQMASYFVAFYTNQTINWGMASSLSTILLVATLALYIVYARHFGPAKVRKSESR
jgi:putative spermidine/putrescine transport system permease protein